MRHSVSIMLNPYAVILMVFFLDDVCTQDKVKARTNGNGNLNLLFESFTEESHVDGPAGLSGQHPTLGWVGNHDLLCRETGIQTVSSFKNWREKDRQEERLFICFTPCEILEDGNGDSVKIFRFLETSLEILNPYIFKSRIFSLSCSKAVIVNNLNAGGDKVAFDIVQIVNERLKTCSPSQHEHDYNYFSSQIEKERNFSSFPLDFIVIVFKDQTFRRLHLKSQCFLKRLSSRHKRSVSLRDKRESDSKNPIPTTLMKEETNAAEEAKAADSTSEKHLQRFFKEFNETAYKILLEQEAMRRRLRRESEIAYLCLVFIILLILFSIWLLRGFHSRNASKREIRHDDKDHYLTVKEVLYRKARYLPMFNKNVGLEEVFVHDCGTNP